jgi:hypothetical protein
MRPARMSRAQPFVTEKRKGAHWGRLERFLSREADQVRQDVKRLSSRRRISSSNAFSAARRFPLRACRRCPLFGREEFLFESLGILRRI